jgi:hypothetical protein
MRLTLVWATPTTVPTIIVAMALAPSSGIQCSLSVPKAVRKTRTKAANAAALTAVDMNPVTMVGAPW